MYIIKRVSDNRYFTGWRRTWTCDIDRAEEYDTKEEAWEDLNYTPGKLSHNRRDLDGDHVLVRL